MRKEDLQDYLWLKRSIKQLEEKRFELETRATRMTSRLDGQPKSPAWDKSKFEDLVIEMVELDEKLWERLKEHYARTEDIERAIQALPERERVLMRARYIEGKTFREIAADTSYSCRHTVRMHGKALRDLEKLS